MRQVDSWVGEDVFGLLNVPGIQGSELLALEMVNAC